MKEKGVRDGIEIVYVVIPLSGGWGFVRWRGQLLWLVLVRALLNFRPKSAVDRKETERGEKMGL